VVRPPTDTLKVPRASSLLISYFHSPGRRKLSSLVGRGSAQYLATLTTVITALRRIAPTSSRQNIFSWFARLSLSVNVDNVGESLKCRGRGTEDGEGYGTASLLVELWTSLSSLLVLGLSIDTFAHSTTQKTRGVIRRSYKSGGQCSILHLYGLI